MLVVNRKAEGEHTQSVLFAKSAGWTKAKSRKWCKEHGYFVDGYDESAKLQRWQQYDIDDKKFNSRNNVIEEKNGKPSITLVLGCPINKQTEDKVMNTEDKVQTKVKAEIEDKTEDKPVEKPAVDPQKPEEKPEEKPVVPDEKPDVPVEASGPAPANTLSNQIANLTESIETLKAQVAANDEKMAAMVAQTEERENIVAGLEQELEKAKEATAELKSSLAIPAALNDAVDGEEKPAESDIVDESDTSGLFAKYQGIGDPKEKNAFWRKHEKALIEEMKNAK